MMFDLKKIKPWQLALAAIAFSGIAGLSSRQNKKTERRIYNKELKQAPWAPPAWAFAPAWSINSFFLLSALRDLIVRKDIPDRKALLTLQAVIWTIFFSFGYIYFGKKSPVLAAVWTVSDALLALRSVQLLIKRDPQVAKKYLPLLVWTTYASTLAIYQAVKNNDPLIDKINLAGKM